MSESVILASAGVLVWGLALSRTGLLLQVQRLFMYARAAGMLLRRAAAAAWNERHWWSWCVERARRSA